MKIAVASDDGCTIAADFERAAYYSVLTTQEGRIAHRELREKVPWGWYEAGGHVEHHGPHAAAPEAVHRHDPIADPIDDCQVVVAAGMPDETRRHLEGISIWPVLVEPAPIDVAVQAFLTGELVGR